MLHRAHREGQPWIYLKNRMRTVFQGTILLGMLCLTLGQDTRENVSTNCTIAEDACFEEVIVPDGGGSTCSQCLMSYNNCTAQGRCENVCPITVDDFVQSFRWLCEDSPSNTTQVWIKECLYPDAATECALLEAPGDDDDRFQNNEDGVSGDDSQGNNNGTKISNSSSPTLAPTPIHTPGPTLAPSPTPTPSPTLTPSPTQASGDDDDFDDLASLDNRERNSRSVSGIIFGGALSAAVLAGVVALLLYRRKWKKVYIGNSEGTAYFPGWTQQPHSFFHRRSSSADTSGPHDSSGAHFPSKVIPRWTQPPYPAVRSASPTTSVEGSESRDPGPVTTLGVAVPVPVAQSYPYNTSPEGSLSKRASAGILRQEVDRQGTSTLDREAIMLLASQPNNYFLGALPSDEGDYPIVNGWDASSSSRPVAPNDDFIPEWTESCPPMPINPEPDAGAGGHCVSGPPDLPSQLLPTSREVVMALKESQHKESQHKEKEEEEEDEDEEEEIIPKWTESMPPLPFSSDNVEMGVEGRCASSPPEVTVRQSPGRDNAWRQQSSGATTMEEEEDGSSNDEVEGVSHRRPPPHDTEVALLPTSLKHEDDGDCMVDVPLVDESALTREEAARYYGDLSHAIHHSVEDSWDSESRGSSCPRRSHPAHAAQAPWASTSAALMTREMFFGPMYSPPRPPLEMGNADGAVDGKGGDEGGGFFEDFSRSRRFFFDDGEASSKVYWAGGGGGEQE